jgi:hypothetical protein
MISGEVPTRREKAGTHTVGNSLEASSSQTTFSLYDTLKDEMDGPASLEAEKDGGSSSPGRLPPGRSKPKAYDLSLPVVLRLKTGTLGRFLTKASRNVDRDEREPGETGITVDEEKKTCFRVAELRGTSGTMSSSAYVMG